jgi:hypothetical protein
MMDFIDQLRVLSAQAEKLSEHIKTEEATKHALVLPFIGALGYNVFDPTEVVPELTADVGIKKGEKVDYAIFKDAQPIILFECKTYGSNLDDEPAAQLFRYFSVTQAKFGVLTNDILYRFYTDIEELNKMDPKPFFEFNILDIREPGVEVLRRFTKAGFDRETNYSAAIELKYTREIKRIVTEQFTSPSESFVRLLSSQVYTGRMTQTTLTKFTEITKRSLNLFITERINDRLKFAMENEQQTAKTQGSGDQQVDQMVNDVIEDGKRIITTEEEMQGWYLIKAILREVIEPKRITIRDTQSYCNILLDDNSRKPICRFYFSNTKKSLGIIGAEKKEDKVVIENIDDIYYHAEQIKAALTNYIQTDHTP